MADDGDRSWDEHRLADAQLDGTTSEGADGHRLADANLDGAPGAGADEDHREDRTGGDAPDEVTATDRDEGAPEAAATELSTSEVGAAGEAPSEPSAAEALLVVEDLVAGYVPGVPILDGCNLVLAEGELVGIVGPNGAGKSTLIKAIFGLVGVWEGAVRLRDENISDAPAHVLVSKGVGYVPQTENVFPSLTIEENLEMGLYLRPKKFKQRFAVVADLFPKLADRRSQRAGSLSGGERQMVAMGRALMMDPSVLLLDEPSAGLSPLLQDEVFLRCREINAAGVSIIMVEQNARRCLQICDRGYVLDSGKNAYTGGGQDLLADPKVIELYLGTLAKAR